MAWTEELTSGRYRGVYRLPSGAKRSAGTFDHKKQAMNAASAKEEASALPNWRDPKTALILWGDWCDKWMLTRSVEASTLRNDHSRLSGRLKPKWRDTPLAEITRHAVKEWAAELRDDGLAPASVQRCISLFSASLAGAVDAEILQANPASRLKLPTPSNQRETYLTREEVGLILGKLKGVDAAMAASLVGTGMRWGEAAGALVEQYDMGSGSYRVSKVWDDVGKVAKDYPKGRKRRSIPVPKWVAEMLEPLVDKRNSGYLFRTPEGQPLDYHNWRNRVWVPAVKAAGLDPVNIHSLRHTYASWLIQDGVSLEEVGKLLGHVSPMTTRRYAHLSEIVSETVLLALPDPRIVSSGSKRGANVGQDDVSNDSNVLPFISRRSRK